MQLFACFLNIRIESKTYFSANITLFILEHIMAFGEDAVIIFDSLFNFTIIFLIIIFSSCSMKVKN